MLFPKFNQVERYREVTTVFGGYNHQISCQDGQFYDMQNMTSRYYPVLSPRKSRGIVKAFNNPQGILDKDDMWWIDDKVLYKNGEAVELKNVNFSDTAPKTMTKMGAIVVVLPDKIWFNAETLECGYMENKVQTAGLYTGMYSLCKADGTAVDWHSEDYFKVNAPKNGDYMLAVNTSGGLSLKIYSEATGIWNTEATTYIQITAPGIGVGFKKDDGVKIYASSNKRLQKVLVNEEDDGRYSVSTQIIDRTNNSIIIPGIVSAVSEEEEDDSTTKEELPETLDEGGTESVSPYMVELYVERSVPDMEYITECNNRLWGCSKDGHEVYCCKLGDVTNWNCFLGISTDSWAATVGSDGKFTGAITYLGYPMFFKEESLIKIAISTTGGHQMKETKCRGVQKGSGRSLAIINETLFFKSAGCVCAYSGSLPFSISDQLGDMWYYDAVASSFGDNLYISMRDKTGKHSMFVYNTKSGIWCKEDDTQVLFFCNHDEELFYIDGTNFMMKSIGGSLPYDVPEKATEKPFTWVAESGVIGYSSPDNKYVARINIRITLELGTNVDFYVQYDSCGEWEHKFNMSGKGTRAFSVPFIPRRCDHFKYKIVGKGDCKIHSITKTIEEGSDL